MKIIIYCLDSFKAKAELKTIFSDIVNVSKLKQDLELLKEKIRIEEPNLVVGIAKSRYSMIETIAVNQFNKSKRVNKSGKNFYQLFVPKELSKVIKINKNYTDSFCNWFSYNIAEYIENSSSETKAVFIHLNEKDVNQLSKLISN